MKSTIAITLFCFSLSAFAIMHFLVAEWYESGNHMCKYDNGTVLNVGYELCPLNI